MGVANDNPNKKPELILEPIGALHMIAALIKPMMVAFVLGINGIVKFHGLFAGDLRNVIGLDVVVLLSLLDTRAYALIFLHFLQEPTEKTGVA